MLTVTKPNTKVILLLFFFVGCSFVFVMVMNRSSRERQKPPRPQVTPLKHTDEDILQQNERNKLFQLPAHQITLPFNKLVRRTWYKDLESFLLTLSVNKVILLSATSTKYIPDLLNWLSAYRVATGSLLSEVLVVSMNLAMHNTFINKGLNSILVKNQDIFLPKCKPRDPAHSIWMKRITVARIINHLGYDVMIIDLDAFVLKDFTIITNEYSTSDVVGSMAKMPPALSTVWGFTMCMGAAFFRSTPGTETFWNAVSNLSREMQDDQIRINYGFKALNISWIQNQSCLAHQEKNECTAKGETDVDFSVTLVPQSVVCRSDCKSTSIDTYYIWHVRHGKAFKLSSSPMWFLKDNWKDTFDKHQKSTEIYQLIDQITAKR